MSICGHFIKGVCGGVIHVRRMEANVMCAHFNFCDALRKEEKKHKAKRRIGAGTQCSDKTAASVAGTQSLGEAFQDGFVVAASQNI